MQTNVHCYASSNCLWMQEKHLRAQEPYSTRALEANSIIIMECTITLYNLIPAPLSKNDDEALALSSNSAPLRIYLFESNNIFMQNHALLFIIMLGHILFKPREQQ